MKGTKFVSYKQRDQERREIYNALCCLNVSIRAKQPKRAKYIQKLIEKWSLWF